MLCYYWIKKVQVTVVYEKFFVFLFFLTICEGILLRLQPRHATFLWFEVSKMTQIKSSKTSIKLVSIKCYSTKNTLTHSSKVHNKKYKSFSCLQILFVVYEQYDEAASQAAGQNRIFLLLLSSLSPSAVSTVNTRHTHLSHAHT